MHARLTTRLLAPSIARVLVIAVLLTAVGRADAALRVSPSSVVLDNPEATQQLLVTSSTAADVTRAVSYESSKPAVAVVDAAGLIQVRGDGKAEIIIRHGGGQVRVPVEVRGVSKPAPVSFEHQIVPLLTKAGCNSGSCHGKAEGKNGFKLSVFGFDPAADYQALVMEARGRRVFPAAAEQSLLLRKAAGLAPHGGGRRIARGSLPYQRLLRWISEGARFEVAGAQPVTRIEIEPAQQVLVLRSTQQLRVTALDAAGQRHCVTAEAAFDSNASTIAAVDGRGWIRAGDVPGEAAILVRYMGHVAVCRVTIPRPGARFDRPSEVNFIDKLAWDKLIRLGIPPSGLCADATFLRRVFLDTIGTLPTPQEARAFLASKAADKRAKLIDQLLDRPEYADYWTMHWSDVLRVDRDMVTAEGAVAMTRWLRKQFAKNRPYDQIVRDILTAKGNTTAEGPAAFYKVLTTPELASRSISQLFLGVRIECAQCHHHPSEKWGQDDYFALAGFFTGLQRKALPGGGEALFARGGLDLNHPRTGKPVATRALGAPAVDLTKTPDRRTALADWMTAPSNPYFARALANRLWAHYFGRGLVEPLDDLRATNPATNEALLDALAKHLRDLKYDLKAFTRTLLNSHLYQLDSRTLAGNASDEQNFSHAAAKPMPAEVLLDAICQATGVPEKFNGWPEGYRAIQVWDNRMPSYFFRIFGRPVRASVCECERGNEPSMAQALHLMNAPEIMDKIRSRRGTARRLADSDKTPRVIIDELYLETLSRFPSDKERAVMLQAFTESGDDRRAAVEDVLWALLNTKEFIYNR
jgi:hypothetical protein